MCKKSKTKNKMKFNKKVIIDLGRPKRKSNTNRVSSNLYLR